MSKGVHRIIRHGILLVAAGLWFCVAGCGGDATVSSKPAQQPSGGKPTPKQARPSPKQASAKQASTDTQEQNADSPGSQSEKNGSSADSGEAFAIVTDQPNFAILGPEPEIKASDVFAVRQPPLNADSSSFVIAEPGRPATPGEQAADFNLPSGFSAIPAAGYSEKGWPRRIRCEHDGSEMALVPAGVFPMGTHDGAPEASPQISVFLGPYYIDVTEVTVEQYATIREDLSEQDRGRILDPPANEGAPAKHPALGIEWGDARRYARAVGKDLPTEAEWEKAARGRHGYQYPWGNTRPIWSPPRSRDRIDPIRSYRSDKSPYGVYDLAGNAREWCADWYSETAFREAAKRGGEVVRNWQGPKRPSAKFQRVVKGNGPGWHLWHRTGMRMSSPAPDVGFRCVLRATSSATSDSDEREQQPTDSGNRTGF